jgi:hypothetical protein
MEKPCAEKAARLNFESAGFGAAPCGGMTRIRFKGSSTSREADLSAKRLPCMDLTRRLERVATESMPLTKAREDHFAFRLGVRPSAAAVLIYSVNP